MAIVLLDKLHQRKAFKCEEDSLTAYIQKQVSQDIKRNVAACFVLPDAHNHVIGYYTLSTESLGRDAIPDQYKKNVPNHYNAPVILLGRLARDQNHKRKGLGEKLLIDALFRSYDLANQSIGAMAVVTDPINEKARDFYLKYGFIELPNSKRLFLPMSVIRKLIE